MQDTNVRLDEVARKQPSKSSGTRRWRRYRVDVRVKVKLANGVAIFGRSTDISEGGMALFAGAALHTGQTIQAELMLPYCTKPVEIHGVIRNRAGFRYGVEFSLVSDHDKVLIDRVCRTLSIVQ